jgi:TonB family protein
MYTSLRTATSATCGILFWPIAIQEFHSGFRECEFAIEELWALQKRLNGISIPLGAVMLDVLVSADGRAAEVVVKRSSGYRILDQAAVAAVRHWLFQPGRTEGLPVASHVDVPVRFRLHR